MQNVIGGFQMHNKNKGTDEEQEPKIEKVKESVILKALYDYEIQPSPELARKLDFYFTPYCKSF